MLIISEEQKQPQWTVEKEQLPTYYDLCNLDCALTIIMTA